MTRIAFVGAGSTVGDVLAQPELAGSTFALMDIDPARLETSRAAAERLVAAHGAQAAVDATLDRRAALGSWDEPMELERSHEYGADIIRACETAEPFRFNGNVVNDRLIDNLPQGCCMEVPCVADARDHPRAGRRATRRSTPPCSTPTRRPSCRSTRSLR